VWVTDNLPVKAEQDAEDEAERDNVLILEAALADAEDREEQAADADAHGEVSHLEGLLVDDPTEPA